MTRDGGPFGDTALNAAAQDEEAPAAYFGGKPLTNVRARSSHEMQICIHESCNAMPRIGGYYTKSSGNAVVLAWNAPYV
jgi:hypothetical protein